MRAGTLITTLSAAATATASSLVSFTPAGSQEQEPVSDWAWAITGWNAGCARQGCFYDFNITAAANATADPQQPAFAAYCSGDGGEGAPYELCTLQTQPETRLRIAAKLLADNSTVGAEYGTAARPTIQVTVQHDDLETPTTWWNYTAKGEAEYNQFVSPPLNFTIVPHEIFGVA